MIVPAATVAACPASVYAAAAVIVPAENVPTAPDSACSTALTSVPVDSVIAAPETDCATADDRLPADSVDEAPVRLTATSPPPAADTGTQMRRGPRMSIGLATSAPVTCLCQTDRWAAPPSSRPQM